MRRIGVFGLMLVVSFACANADEAAYEDHDRGLTVDYPEDWQVRSMDTLLPQLRDPRPVVALGTFTLPAVSDKCSIFPLDILRGVGSEDALVLIYERLDGRVQGRGQLGRLGPADARASDTSTLCEGAPARHYFLDLIHEGRALQIYIGLGEDATESREAEAWQVANSLHVEKRLG